MSKSRVSIPSKNSRDTSALSSNAVKSSLVSFASEIFKSLMLENDKTDNKELGVSSLMAIVDC